MSTDTAPLANSSTQAFEYQLFPGKVVRVATDVNSKHYDAHTIPFDEDMNATMLATTMHEVYVASESHLYRIYDDRLLLDGKPQKKFRKMQLCEDIPSIGIKQISGGGSHLLILDTQSCPWSLGIGKHGELGLDGKKVAVVPELVYGLETIVQVAAGRYHSLALTNDGDVFGWGWNFFCQLGYDFREEHQWEPRWINEDKYNRPAVSISTTGHLTEITLKDGGILQYGSEDNYCD